MKINFGGKIYECTGSVLVNDNNSWSQQLEKCSSGFHSFEISGYVGELLSVDHAEGVSTLRFKDKYVYIKQEDYCDWMEVGATIKIFWDPNMGGRIVLISAPQKFS